MKTLILFQLILDGLTQILIELLLFLLHYTHTYIRILYIAAEIRSDFPYTVYTKIFPRLFTRVLLRAKFDVADFNH